MRPERSRVWSPRAWRHLGLLVVACALLALTFASSASAFATGFGGDPVLTDGSVTATARWIPDAVSEGAGIVRFNVFWNQIAPARRPQGFDAANPASTGYRWAPVDAAVRQLSNAGLSVLMNISMAPTWAEGRHRPRSARAGTWRPSATQFGAFAAAAAARYDGRFPDPSQPGRSLPRVRYWQGWNEPNLAFYLGPQWIRSRHRWLPESPTIFRALMNAFYRSVKSVSPSNFVVMAGTAPYGDPPGQARMPPIQFDRYLFCLSSGLTPTPCANPVHLDAVAHHPYGIGGPLWHAGNPDDAAVADLYKVDRVLRAAERTRHVLPVGHKQLWVTEISWDSDPPDPHGVPIQRQARWYEQALYVLWRQHVDTVLFIYIADGAPVPNYASSYQAGLYFLNGDPKPAATAFRFPFVTQRVRGSSAQAWVRAPLAGRLEIERKVGAGWSALKSFSVRYHQIVTTTLHLSGAARLRARIGPETSLVWTQQ